MATFHYLRIQRRELLEQLEEMEEALAEVAARLEGVADPIPEELLEYHEHRAWLQRQQAGALVILNETERALLEFGVENWDEP